MTQTESILGYQVYKASCELLIEALYKSIGKYDRCRWLACLNPHSYVVALKDERFRQALHSADWLVPDGIGILLASRAKNGEVEERITGWDVFRGLHDRLEKQGGGRVFLFGASEDTLQKMRRRLSLEYPNIELVGTYSPPFAEEFSQEQNAAMIEIINSSGANVLWVAMTAPKQEKWLYQNAENLNVDLAFGVGAVFDFYAGKVKKSPDIFANSGLEWLPRLIQEPKRLWRRMMVSAPIFVWHVLKDRAASGSSGRPDKR